MAKMNDARRRPWLAHYSPWVPPELPFPSASVIDRFEAAARKNPQTPAICYFDQVLSYGLIEDYARRFAALLAHRGIGRGDRVALYLQNVPQFVFAALGAWKRGASIVPLNPMFKERELAFHLQDSGAKVLVCLESLFESTARNAVARSAVEHILTTSEIEHLPASTIRDVPMLKHVERRRFPETTD